MKDFNSIKPSKEQENCISYKAGDLLVNGVPGAGKSIVLLKRALEFYKASRQGDKRVILLTTFNNTLNDYTTDVFQQANIDEDRMSIITMDRYCSKVYRHFFGSFNAITKDTDRKSYVSQALQNHYRKNGKKHRFYDVDEQFWCDEFLWIKQKNIKTPQEYLEAERTGRGGGVRITREERKIVYELFTEYCNVLNQRHRVDWEDLYIRIINSNVDLTQFQYKYVLVDEAQDLSFVKLKVAKMLAADSITIAADKAQKIYNTGFTWRELGIDVRGNASKTLHKTFRSTKQIVQLAESLSEINRARDGEKGEYTDPVLPTLLGEDYPLIIRCANAADERNFLSSLITGLLADDVTVGVLYRNYAEKEEITRFLASFRISSEEIKRDSKWSLRRKGVKLATLHSSKGLEFDIVIIPFFNSTYYPPQSEIDKADTEQIEEIKAKERNLLYVGMTRAKSALYFTYSGAESPFMSEFSPEYYNYVSSAGNELDKPERSFSPAEKSAITVNKNDTIRAHYEGDATPRTLCGKGIENWPFVGKKVGDSVPGIRQVYIIDEIIRRTSAPIGEPSQKDIWEENKKYVDKSCHGYINRLISFGIPAPTTIGSELMGPDGDVIAEAELAWEQEKTVFLRKDQIQFKGVWQNKGWTVITEDTPATSVELSGVIV